MLRIIVDLFSGRPNPTWIITDEDYTQKLLSQLSELADYIRDPDEVFPGLGFRGIQLQRLGDDEQSRGLPQRFAIATGRSEEPPEMMEIAHEIQLSSYAYLFRRLADREEAGLEIRSLVKSKTPQVHFHRFQARTDAHLRRLFSVVRAYLDDLDAGRYVYRPGFGCGMCDYRDRCCVAWDGSPGLP